MGLASVGWLAVESNPFAGGDRPAARVCAGIGGDLGEVRLVRLLRGDGPEVRVGIENASVVGLLRL